jgi:AraC-like DNA-binding protein
MSQPMLPPEVLVDAFISAWNQRDAPACVKLMTDDAEYVDVFWSEVCKGPELFDYFSAWFSVDPHVYCSAGDVKVENDCAILRYSAHKHTNSGLGPAQYNGAEIFTFRDSRIASIRDIYCDQSEQALNDLATLAVAKADQPKYAKSGLTATLAAQYKRKLLTLMDIDEVFTDPALTLPTLADMVGCSPNHLSQVLNGEFGLSFRAFLNQYRIRHAKNQMIGGGDERHALLHIAHNAGFESISAFYKAFRKTCELTPKQFRNLYSNEKRKR